MLKFLFGTKAFFSIVFGNIGSFGFKSYKTVVGKIYTNVATRYYRVYYESRFVNNKHGRKYFHLVCVSYSSVFHLEVYYKIWKDILNKLFK